MNIRIHSKLFNEIATNFRIMAQLLDKYVNKMVGNSSYALYSQVLQNVPVRSGKLKRSISIRPQGENRFFITEGVIYGQYIREGTKGGYPIYPVNKKALWWPGLEHPIAYVSNHPGIAPNDYAQKAYTAAGGQFDTNIRMMQNEVADKLTGNR